MIIKYKSIILLLFLLGMFSINSLGQTEDEQIVLLQKQNKELKQKLIKKLEEENRKLEMQIEDSSINRTNSDSVTPQSPNIPSTPTSTVQPPVPSETNPPPATSGDTTAAGENNGSGNSSQDKCVTNALNPADATRFQEAICTVTNRILAKGFSLNLSSKQISDFLAAKLAKNENDKSFFLASERKRTDKQVGAAPNGSGTTSLVVKGGAPALIGWAVEQGAATSEVSGNTVTVRFNPYNLGKSLFYNQGLVDLKLLEPKDDAFNTFLRKLSVGLSFDTTRGNESPVFIVSRQQLSSFSVRYEFINRRNPLSARHNTARLAFFDKQKGNLDKIALAINKIVDADNNRFRNELLNTWLDETKSELAKIDPSLPFSVRRELTQQVIEKQAEKLPTEELAKQPEFTDAIQSFIEGSVGFKNGTNELIDSFSKEPIVTFEYTNNREPIKPDTSNFRFIWEKGLSKRTDFTFNGSLTMYNKKPNILNVSRIRDFQFALQTDTKFPTKTELGDFLLSFAGRYERLNTDTVDDMGIVKPGTKGDLAFGQIKLTIPIANLGVRLPISMTFANRTELIKESHIRANFGFTFDLDPIFAKFKPF